MNDRELLIDICNREESSRLYDIKIGGISIYNFVRRNIIEKVASVYNLGSKYSLPEVPINEYRLSVIKSFFQILKLFVCKRRINVFIYAFSRIEKVNGQYLDKFTDPLIDLTNIKNSYIIFENGRNGRHLKPRYHHKYVVYSDFIPWLAWHLPYIKKRMKSQYAEEFRRLEDLISSCFPELSVDREQIIGDVISALLCVKLYGYIFKWFKIYSFIGPARDGFLNIIPAAKKNGVKVFELQHGITYGESMTYSGYRDELFTPDLFLSFGILNSAKCYGISEDKVVEIGWAFEKYLKKKELNTDEDLSVLVISSPAISEKMVNVTCEFASQYPQVLFYFRPHPNEQLDSQILERLKSLPNIRIDNNQENVMVALMRFDNVMGENSTVLYEALSMGKKVGKLNLYGLTPQYLKGEDKACFYEITDAESFAFFMNSPVDDGKPKKRLYTEFNPEAINQLLK